VSRATQLRSHTVKLAERQRWFCIWCEFRMASDMSEAGKILDLETMSIPAIITKATRRRARMMIRATFDHVVPKALGGSNECRNGLAACAWCNQFRGVEEPETFKPRVMALVAAGLHPRQVFRETGKWNPQFPAKAPIEVAA
jgi:hypothetical protein